MAERSSARAPRTGRAGAGGRLVPGGGSAAGRAAPALRLRLRRPGRRLHRAPGPGRPLLLPVRRGLRRLRGSGRGAGAAARPALPAPEAAHRPRGHGRGWVSAGPALCSAGGRRRAAALALPGLAAARVRPGRGGCGRHGARSVLFLSLSAGGLWFVGVRGEGAAVPKQRLPGLRVQPARGRDRCRPPGLPGGRGVPAERGPRCPRVPHSPQAETEASTIMRALE